MQQRNLTSLQIQRIDKNRSPCSIPPTLQKPFRQVVRPFHVWAWRSNNNGFNSGFRGSPFVAVAAIFQHLGPHCCKAEFGPTPSVTSRASPTPTARSDSYVWLTAVNTVGNVEVPSGMFKQCTPAKQLKNNWVWAEHTWKHQDCNTDEFSCPKRLESAKWSANTLALWMAICMPPASDLKLKCLSFFKDEAAQKWQVTEKKSWTNSHWWTLMASDGCWWWLIVFDGLWFEGCQGARWKATKYLASAEAPLWRSPNQPWGPSAAPIAALGRSWSRSSSWVSKTSFA